MGKRGRKETSLQERLANQKRLKYLYEQVNAAGLCNGIGDFAKVLGYDENYMSRVLNHYQAKFSNNLVTKYIEAKVHKLLDNAPKVVKDEFHVCVETKEEPKLDMSNYILKAEVPRIVNDVVLHNVYPILVIIGELRQPKYVEMGIDTNDAVKCVESILHSAIEGLELSVARELINIDNDHE